MMRKDNFMSKKINNQTKARLVCSTCPPIAPCPSVFETDNNTYIIIGKKLTMGEIGDNVRAKIGKGEAAIEVPVELIRKVK